METDILNELYLIRIYVFIGLCVLSLWFFLNIINYFANIYHNLKKAKNAYFENKVEDLLDKGEYHKAIEECENKLKNYPNHLYATWFIAQAYYNIEDFSASKTYFIKTIQLAPAWKNNVSPYLTKINDR